MVSPTSFFRSGLCRPAISVDTLEPQDIEDALGVSALKRLIVVLEEDVRNLKVNFIDPRDIRSEDPNVLISKLAEEHGNLENVGLLKKFHEREILEILREKIPETDIRRGVAKILKRLYRESLINDKSILDLEAYLKTHIELFRKMLSNNKHVEDQGLKNLSERGVESIKQEIQGINTLDTAQQIKEFQSLLNRDVFKFCQIQGILDKRTLRRLDDYLKFKRSQLQDYYISGSDFNLIKSHIDHLEGVCELQKQIKQRLDSLKAQSRIESYHRNKNMLLSAYSRPLWNAVYERVVELISDSYNTNLELQRKLAEIGCARRGSITSFLNYANFNKLLNCYYSDKTIDDLVKFFLDNLSYQQLDKLSALIKERPRNDHKIILLRGFRELDIKFEDL